MSTAERVRLPDDCTVGYIVEGLLGARLLPSSLFHSHLENLQRLPPDAVLQQVWSTGCSRALAPGASPHLPRVPGPSPSGLLAARGSGVLPGTACWLLQTVSLACWAPGAWMRWLLVRGGCCALQSRRWTGPGQQQRRRGQSQAGALLSPPRPACPGGPAPERGQGVDGLPLGAWKPEVQQPLLARVQTLGGGEMWWEGERWGDAGEELVLDSDLLPSPRPGHLELRRPRQPT